MGIPDTPTTANPERQPAAPVLGEVRYSLPELLNELLIERTVGSFSQEKLHQAEISKLFTNRKKRSAAALP